MIAFALEDLIGDLGFDPVGPAFRLAEALALAALRGFDAAILDVRLNEERSFSEADYLAERGVPLMFATGYAEGRVGWSGEAKVIAKPYVGNSSAAHLPNCWVEPGDLTRDMSGVGHRAIRPISAPC